MLADFDSIKRIAFNVKGEDGVFKGQPDAIEGGEGVSAL
jgi:hypothetical protein